VVSDVRLRHDRVATGCPHGRDDVVAAVGRPIDQDEPGAEPAEGDGRGLADAAQAAGDEDDGFARDLLRDRRNVYRRAET